MADSSGDRMLRWMLIGFLLVTPALQAATAPVVLVPHHDVAREVAAFPRVKAGVGVRADRAARINRSLTRLDAEIAGQVKTCKAFYAESPVFRNDPEGARHPWQRTVEVKMLGPRYLSMVATDSYYCGGAHPDDGLVAVVFDLTTGSRLPWLKVLPREARGVSDDSPRGSVEGLVQWAELTRRAADAAEGDCRDALESQEQLGFALWLDGPMDRSWPVRMACRM